MKTVNEVIKALEEHGEVLRIVETEKAPLYNTFHYVGETFSALVREDFLINGESRYRIVDVIIDF